MNFKYVLTLGLALVTLSSCLVTRSDLKGSEGRGQTQDQVVQMQRNSAGETASRVSDLEATIRELNGRLEVLENRSGQTDQFQSKSQRLIEEQMAESNKKVQLLQDEITKLETQVQALIAVSSASSQVREERIEKKGPFQEAEELFNKKDFKKAIISYEKYRTESPKGKGFAEATYKIGVCFQELGMKEEAKTFYDELIVKFPNATESRRAKIRLKKIK